MILSYARDVVSGDCAMSRSMHGWVDHSRVCMVNSPLPCALNLGVNPWNSVDGRCVVMCALFVVVEELISPLHIPAPCVVYVTGTARRTVWGACVRAAWIHSKGARCGVCWRSNISCSVPLCACTNVAVRGGVCPLAAVLPFRLAP